MFRLWAREFKENHILKDTQVIDGSDETRTHKIFNALDKVCIEFDLSKPIWLDSNIETFKKSNRTRFGADNFIDEIDFDYLEIEILEEDFNY